MTRRLLAGLALATLTGCESKTGTGLTAPAAVTAPSPRESSPAPVEAVTLREVTVEGFQ